MPETNIPADYDLESYSYELPENLIASHPAAIRDQSRLLIGPGRADKPYRTKNVFFDDIAKFLPQGALLVVNNTKVLPARLHGYRPNGGKAEFLLLTPLPLLAPEKTENGWNMAICEALLKPSGKFKTGECFTNGENIKARIIEKMDFGKCKMELFWTGNLEKIFQEKGELPLPPYIKRPLEENDKKSYQTVFAQKIGAVAAPTAGLHFTSNLLSSLSGQGFQTAEVTLHAGYGTFTPVRCRDIRNHVMHKEYFEIGKTTAELLLKAKKEGRPIIAVGTTSLRAMEGMFSAMGAITPFSGWTDIFIYPGKTVNIADGLITNFHLPRSSLLMLVAALTGREKILRAYKEAINLGFHFFSYGDAMLIL